MSVIGMERAVNALTGPAVEGFAHPALFYHGPREYLAGTVPFVQMGLSSNEPVAVAVPGRNLELLRSELGAAAEGVLFLDMTEAGRNPGRIIPGVLSAFADAYPDGRVRIIGEPIWPSRSATEYPACVQHEALINVAFSGRAVSILCPYDAERLEPGVLDDAAATHPVLVDASGQWDSREYAPERMIQACNQSLPDPVDAARLDFDQENLGRVRHFAAEHAAAAGLMGDRLDNLRLVVHELATNSVDYGGGSGVLRIWAEFDQVVFDVTDRGHITDSLAGRRPVDARQVGSRGLLITNYLSDLVRVHTREGATTIRIYLDVRSNHTSASPRGHSRSAIEGSVGREGQSG